jgi:RNA polymerase sigma factor (sigma-70 family)
MANPTEQSSANATILTELLPRHQAELMRQARRHARNAADSEEALQRAYELFIERYRPPYEPVAWLQTTIKRCAWETSRRAARRGELSLDAPLGAGERAPTLGDYLPSGEPELEERVGERLEHERVVEAMEALKPDERTALLMLGLGCSYGEIAQRRGWSRTKVNRCLAEGRASVRAKVG